jgi:hypothetical protein
LELVFFLLLFLLSLFSFFSYPYESVHEVRVRSPWAIPDLQLPRSRFGFVLKHVVLDFCKGEAG